MMRVKEEQSQKFRMPEGRHGTVVTVVSESLSCARPPEADPP